MSEEMKQDGNALASLAILSVNISERGQSYFDHFVPFVLEVLITDCKGRGTTGDVAEGLLNNFHLKFEKAVVRNILKRAERKSLISRSHDSDIYSVRPGLDVGQRSFTLERARCLREQASLAQLLSGFSKDRFQLTWSLDVAEVALQEFIAKMSTTRIRQVFGSAPNSGNENSRLTSEISQTFIVGEFIAEIVERNPEAFSWLENLVKGSMLASMLYLPGPVETSRKFRDTTLWIDSPIALQWLGLVSDEAEVSCDAMMRLAQSQGARIGIFSHSVKELRSVINAASDGITYLAPGAKPNPLTLKFRDEGVSYSEARLLAYSIENRLLAKGVVIEEAPDFETRYSVDEAELDRILQETVGYQYPAAKLCDLYSLTAINRLRRGSNSDFIEDCRALLVTANPKLVKASKRFFNRSPSEWPLAIVDDELAALLWSKSPLLAPDLPRGRIIADALICLQPSQELWSKYMDTLDQLADSESDLSGAIMVLRYDSEARRILMEESLGDPSNVTTELVKKILNELKDTAIHPVKAELATTREILSQKETELEKTTENLRDQEVEKSALIARLQKLEVANEKQKKRALDRSNFYKKLTTRSLKAVGVIFVVIWVCYTLLPHFGVWEQISAGYRRFLIIVGLLVILVFGILALFGESWFGYSTRIGNSVGLRLQQRYYSRLGISEEIST